MIFIFCFEKNEAVVYLSKQFRKYGKLSSLIINTVELYECFMKRYKELMDRLSLSFSFANCLFFRYRLEFLKNEFSVTNVLVHLIFSSKSFNSTVHCKQYSQLFFKSASDFVSLIRYHFSLIFTRINIFNN